MSRTRASIHPPVVGRNSSVNDGRETIWKGESPGYTGTTAETRNRTKDEGKLWKRATVTSFDHKIEVGDGVGIRKGKIGECAVFRGDMDSATD